MENINKSIQCTVEECRYHCSDCDYCSLDKILVGSHEKFGLGEYHTDCKSFDAGR